MKKVTEKAYAKINLGLNILGQRDDGYHEVSMIMQSLALCDDVVISEGKASGTITAETDMPGLGCGSDNLACRAAALLAGHCGITPNVHIVLKKRIFLAAGLAGGSSDAAAVLRGLNRLWKLNLSNDELRVIGARLGSDVPFCIEGGTALATGRGEIITQCEDLPETAVVLAKPKDLEISTAWVYRNYNAGRVVHAPKIWCLKENIGSGPRALMPYMANVLETVTIPANPVIASVKAAMLGGGAYFAMMSGSGPTVFALADNMESAERVQQALGDFAVETVITATNRRMK